MRRKRKNRRILKLSALLSDRALYTAGLVWCICSILMVGAVLGRFTHAKEAIGVSGATDLAYHYHVSMVLTSVIALAGILAFGALNFYNVSHRITSRLGSAFKDLLIFSIFSICAGAIIAYVLGWSREISGAFAGAFNSQQDLRANSAAILEGVFYNMMLVVPLLLTAVVRGHRIRQRLIKWFVGLGWLDKSYTQNIKAHFRYEDTPSIQRLTPAPVVIQKQYFVSTPVANTKGEDQSTLKRESVPLPKLAKEFKLKETKPKVSAQAVNAKASKKDVPLDDLSSRELKRRRIKQSLNVLMKAVSRPEDSKILDTILHDLAESEKYSGTVSEADLVPPAALATDNEGTEAPAKVIWSSSERKEYG